MEAGTFFRLGFEALSYYPPFDWQGRMYDRFLASGADARASPAALDIPTGLGKTSIIVIWLLALAWQASNGASRLPRRMVYVVDRRTVVDQATDIAVGLRASIRNAAPESPAAAIRDGLRLLCLDPDEAGSPLAISTLRGEFADNREWQSDPARAAIIVGTVDMIGSRLLFSGYGVSRRMRPFHAGLLGQDSLIVHDEAHLSPAFGNLIGGIRGLQEEANEPRPIRVMELSATQRGAAAGEVLRLTDEDRANPTVARRLEARKCLRLHAVPAGTRPEDALAELATAHGAEQARVVVYVRSPKVATAVAYLIEKQAGRDHVATLTGTIRGHERDRLVTSALFHDFRAKPCRERPERTEYLNPRTLRAGYGEATSH